MNAVFSNQLSISLTKTTNGSFGRKSLLWLIIWRFTVEDWEAPLVWCLVKARNGGGCADGHVVSQGAGGTQLK